MGSGFGWKDEGLVAGCFENRSMHEARREWAAIVREITPAAAARELGISPQAVADRLKTVDGRSRKRPSTGTR